MAKRPSLKDYAHLYRERSFSIIPCCRKEKCPVGFLLPKNENGLHSWEQYKERVATEDEVGAWFSHESVTAIGLIVGRVSGGLEVIDHDAPELFAPWCRVVEDISPDLMNRLFVAQTQSSGCHVYYYCDRFEGNQKLASKRDDDGRLKCLIETRGEGGYVLAYPTPGYSLLNKNPWEIPTLTVEERDVLLDAARSFNEIPQRVANGYNGVVVDGSRPGDDYNERGNPIPILEKHGWVVVNERGNTVALRRPGKTGRGCSATWNHIPKGFYCFSTNGAPFEAETLYRPFAIYTLLETGGDYEEAARRLARDGYGAPRKTITISATSHSVVLSECPSLPSSVVENFDVGSGADNWLNTYIGYAASISPMTPRSFHQSAGLWLTSVAIARRLVFRAPFGDIYPNLFILWIAPTTLYRKSTALNVAQRIARRLFPHLLAVQDTTPEAFLSDLSGAKPTNFDDLKADYKRQWLNSRDFAAQKGWMLDEMSGLLASAGRDYNAGLLETLLRFYDCEDQFCRSTRGQGHMAINGTYLSFIGASTPAALSNHLLEERLWSMGWWPRFSILTPEDEKPEWKNPILQDEPQSIASDLVRLYERLPEAHWPTVPEPIDVLWSQDVADTWNKYNEMLSHDLLTPDIDGRLWGSYGRLPGIALRVAMLLCAMDWAQQESVPRIQLRHLVKAIEICEEWRESAHRAVEQAAISDFNALRIRILRQITKDDEGAVSFYELTVAMRDKSPDEIKDVLRQMQESGEVEKFRKTHDGPGRPTDKYRLTDRIT